MAFSGFSIVATLTSRERYDLESMKGRRTGLSMNAFASSSMKCVRLTGEGGYRERGCREEVGDGNVCGKREMVSQRRRLVEAASAAGESRE